MASLLNSLRKAGAHEQAAALLARDPAAHVALERPADVARLLDALREAGAHEQAAALAGRAAARAPLNHPAVMPCAGAAGDDAGGEGDVHGAGGGQHERQERPWTPKPKR